MGRARSWETRIKKAKTLSEKKAILEAYESYLAKEKEKNEIDKKIENLKKKLKKEGGE